MKRNKLNGNYLSRVIKFSSLLQSSIKNKLKLKAKILKGTILSLWLKMKIFPIQAFFKIFPQTTIFLKWL